MDVVWEWIYAILVFRYINEVVFTFAVIVIRKIILSWWLHRLIDSSEGQYETLVQHRQSIHRWVNWSTIGVLLLVWFAQVQNVLISFVAIAAALVVATKDVILCVMGGFYLRFSHAFSVKDRIEIHGIRGFVLEIGVLYTRVLEIGPEKESQQTTGSIITIPHSLLLSHPLKNESFFAGYSIKSFTFHVPKTIELEEAEIFLKKVADDIVAPYQEIAQKEIVDFCKASGLALPAVNARIKLILAADGSASLLLKVPIESHRIADVEQRLVRQYVQFVKARSSSNTLKSE